MQDPVIEARKMSAGYGAVPVVRGIDLEVRPGELVALLGANGAGKTTTLMALSGALPLSDGQVLWKGSTTKAPLHRRARAGLSFVTDERSIFFGLTTRDNLRLGRGSLQKALGLFPELERLLDRRAGLLSGGEQQMLTVGRALSGQPSLLLADELSLGLAPLIVRRLLTAVREAADRGAAVLIVEQQARLALQFADRAYVLQRGEMVISGTSTELIDRLDDIESSYLEGVAPSTEAPTSTLP